MDQDKWEVEYDGEVGTFYDAIADKKEFDGDRENIASMVGEGHDEVEDKYNRFVPVLNDNINAMKKGILNDDIFR